MVPNDLYMRCPELIAPISSYVATYSSLFANSDALVNYWITTVTPYFDATKWNGSLNDGMIWRVAHEIATQIKYNEDTDQSIDGLGINRVRIGSENVSTRQLATNEADSPYKGTKYGQRYLQMLRNTGSRILAA